MYVYVMMTGSVKTRHICTFYTCLQISTFPGHCLHVYTCFLIDLST